MSVDFFSSRRIKAEQAARTARREELRQAFAAIATLVINTGTHTKAEAAASIAAALVNPSIKLDSPAVIIQPSTKEEPVSPYAIQVAAFKARSAREEYVEKRMNESTFMFAQLAQVVFYGADINAFAQNPSTGILEQSHKKSREFPVSLPESAFMQLRAKLYQHYIYPPSGFVRMVWDISEDIFNGKEHQFSDLVEIIAKPLDAELLELYLQYAVADGKILNSNTHLAAFEMLMESGKIQTTARLSNHLLAKGYRFADFRQSPKQEELIAIKQSIVGNQPVHVA